MLVLVARDEGRLLGLRVGRAGLLLGSRVLVEGPVLLALLKLDPLGSPVGLGYLALPIHVGEVTCLFNLKYNEVRPRVIFI